MKKRLAGVGALFILVTMGLSGYVNAAEVTINYVTFVNRMHLYAKTFQQSFGIIEERSNGRIKFNYRGGPEAIKIFAQAMAAKKGATDMVFTTPSFTGKLVKGPLMLTLSQSPVAKHRETGLYAYLNEVYNPVGVQFIQMIPEAPGKIFRMLCKDKIEKTSDLKGKSLRGGDWMDAVAPAFDMKTVAIRHNEDYSGLERGIIDISRMTIGSMVVFKLHEVAKYLLSSGWGTAPASLLMNIKKWNSIPKDLQDLIIDTMYELAPQTEEKFKKEAEKNQALMISKGVEVIKLQDEEYFLKTAESKMYDYFLKDNPEVAKKIYELTH